MSHFKDSCVLVKTKEETQTYLQKMEDAQDTCVEAKFVRQERKTILEAGRQPAVHLVCQTSSITLLFL